MSVSHLRTLRWTFLAAFSVAAGLTFASTSRAGDPLDRFKAKQAIEAQKTLREVRGLIADARRLESKDPSQARTLLRQARGQLADALGVSERERAQLSQQIRNALRSVEAAIRESDNQAKVEAYREAQRAAAREKSRELEAQKRLGSPIGRADGMIKTAKSYLGSYDRLRQQRESGILAATLDIYESASRMQEERITKRFIASKGRDMPKLTEAEKHLLKMLNSTMTPSWDKQPLKDVIELIQDKAKISIFIDENSLKEANVEYDDPVTFKGPKTTVRVILKKILADKGLTFIIKDAAVQVMTPEKAKQFMVTRTYPVADLLPLANPQMGPFFNRAQMIQAVNDLITMIVSTVEPGSWQVNGGTGTISFLPTAQALIIRQTAEFHYQMGGFLSR
jgi:hypothetical protein